jgi:hypothetical protein
MARYNQRKSIARHHTTYRTSRTGTSSKRRKFPVRARFSPTNLATTLLYPSLKFRTLIRRELHVAVIDLFTLQMRTHTLYQRCRLSCQRTLVDAMNEAPNFRPQTFALPVDCSQCRMLIPVREYQLSDPLLTPPDRDPTQFGAETGHKIYSIT